MVLTHSCYAMARFVEHDMCMHYLGGGVGHSIHFPTEISMVFVDDHQDEDPLATDMNFNNS